VLENQVRDATQNLPNLFNHLQIKLRYAIKNWLKSYFGLFFFIIKIQLHPLFLFHSIYHSTSLKLFDLVHYI